MKKVYFELSIKMMNILSVEYGINVEVICKSRNLYNAIYVCCFQFSLSEEISNFFEAIDNVPQNEACVDDLVIKYLRSLL